MDLFKHWEAMNELLYEELDTERLNIFLEFNSIHTYYVSV
jgi:hypothetical protein